MSLSSSQPPGPVARGRKRGRKPRSYHGEEPLAVGRVQEDDVEPPPLGAERGDLGKDVPAPDLRPLPEPLPLELAPERPDPSRVALHEHHVPGPAS